MSGIEKAIVISGPKLRTAFFVDGFNLYHSLKDAEEKIEGSTRWLDLRFLCESHLYLISRRARLQKVYYFSALAKHLTHKKPDVVNRHKKYIRCISDTGVEPDLADFKNGKEKETDVKIAVRLLETFHNNNADVAVVVSGDTDLAPVFRACSRMHPDKQVWAAFPYNRKNSEIAQLADDHFQFRPPKYGRAQFDDPYHLDSGSQMEKPEHW